MIRLTVVLSLSQTETPHSSNNKKMLGLIIGLVGSVLPKLLKIWEETIDFRREIKMLRLQSELAPAAPTPEMAALDLSDIQDARRKDFAIVNKVHGVLGNIVRAVISLVRPTVTFAVVGVWATWKIITIGPETTWDQWEIDVIFFTITFYFGQRAFTRGK